MIVDDLDDARTAIAFERLRPCGLAARLRLPERTADAEPNSLGKVPKVTPAARDPSNGLDGRLSTHSSYARYSIIPCGLQALLALSHRPRPSLRMIKPPEQLVENMAEPGLEYVHFALCYRHALGPVVDHAPSPRIMVGRAIASTLDRVARVKQQISRQCGRTWNALRHAWARFAMTRHWRRRSSGVRFRVLTECSGKARTPHERGQSGDHMPNCACPDAFHRKDGLRSDTLPSAPSRYSHVPLKPNLRLLDVCRSRKTRDALRQLCIPERLGQPWQVSRDPVGFSVA